MTDDVVSRLLAAIEQREQRFNERLHDPYEGLSDDELHQRHAHRAYEYRTTEGQRKAWDDADTPPEGDGWELNVTSRDRDAFERFDYHEERYWRRLRPDGPRERLVDVEAAEGLRLCQAHREIVALHPAGEGADADLCKLCDMLGQNEDCTYPCDTIRALARGYSIEEDA